MAYEERFYRKYHNNLNQLKFIVCVEETDLLIIMDDVDDISILKQLIKCMVLEIRKKIISFSKIDPEFLTALKPIIISPEIIESQKKGQDIIINKNIIKMMYDGSITCNVGPMATVAGVTAQVIVESLISKYGNINIIIENGGDIFMNTLVAKKVSVYAGNSSLSNKLALLIQPEDTPISICTSSGTIGHSLSFGKADAVVVVSKQSAIADGAATYLCNQIQSAKDINKTLSLAKSINGVIGVIIIVGEQMGIVGDINITKI